MVYINSWQKYQEAAENLYANSPRKVWPPNSVPSSLYVFSLGLADGLRKTRYSVKWRSSEGKLVLKITDDVTVRVSALLLPFLTYIQMC